MNDRYITPPRCTGTASDPHNETPMLITDHDWRCPACGRRHADALTIDTLNPRRQNTA